MYKEDTTSVSDKYVAAANKIALNETDRLKRQAYIIELSAEGFNKQEVQELNTLYGFSNDSKVDQAVGWLKNFLGQTKHVESSTAKAAFTKDFVSRMAKGEDPTKVIEEISASALTYQSLLDKPEIASYPPSGQLMVDPSGAVARVYANGRREDR